MLVAAIFAKMSNLVFILSNTKSIFANVFVSVEIDKVEADIDNGKTMFDYAVMLRQNSTAHAVCDIVKSMKSEPEPDCFNHEFEGSDDVIPNHVSCDYWNDFGDEREDDLSLAPKRNKL